MLKWTKWLCVNNNDLNIQTTKKLDFHIWKDFVYLVFVHMETKNGLQTLGKEIAQLVLS